MKFLPTLGEIFFVFLKLGCTSFGGPTAHLGYFNRELVRKRQWIDEAGYIDLMTLCQFLPGPTSSQIGFSLGVLRAGGWWGGLVAWVAFTLPSTVLLVVAAYGVTFVTGDIANRILHGLMLVAVAVVASAIFSMVQGFQKEPKRIAMALVALPIIAVLGVSLGQIVAIGCGALAGLRFCSGMNLSAAGLLRFPVAKRQGAVALVLFLAFFFCPPFLAAYDGTQAVALFDVFYHAGSLVFGGGHVVLPLLQNQIVPNGWMTNETFLTGYGLAQAIPGPLFSLAAYLGAVMGPEPHGLAGAFLALVAIFLPGLLLVYGTLPYWDVLRERDAAASAMRGVTASVVGILAMAFYNNVLLPTVHNGGEAVLALAGFVALSFAKIPSWAVVLGLVAAAVLAGA